MRRSNSTKWTRCNNAEKRACASRGDGWGGEGGSGKGTEQRRKRGSPGRRGDERCRPSYAFWYVTTYAGYDLRRSYTMYAMWDPATQPYTESKPSLGLMMALSLARGSGLPTTTRATKSWAWPAGRPAECA
jgi:hypothetical protein